MEELHTAGIALAAALQERLLGSEHFWLLVTYLGDPGCIFLIYFPLAYCFHRRLGVSVLWIALIAEWLNVVFKWLLFGERPFWWVYDSGRFSDVKLRQFSSTCETGPGSPSGHCMITGAALWPAMMSITAHLSHRHMQRLVPPLLYALLMVGVAISRVLILAHFPHQVLAGILAGVVLGHVLWRRVPQEQGVGFFFLTSLLLLLGAVVLHWSMSIAGLDVSWSIHLATKWCSRPEWIRPETRPFSSLTRSAGNALGLGLALNCPLHDQLPKDTPGWRERVLRLILSIVLQKILYSIPLPLSPSLLFYSLNFLRHLLCPLAVISFAPFITKRLRPQTSSKSD